MAHATAADHLQTSTGLDNRKLLMWLFLASDCLFFGSFIAAYLLYRGRSVVGP
ncbi:MAG: cytochrome oxidase subunit III, partial [Chloroflexi bacterium]|nr:cytochrome oxidase subunit III [Chloroflexota bacterium]